MASPLLIAAHQPGKPSLNSHLIGFEITSLIIGVGCLQPNSPRLFAQGFQRSFMLFNQCDHYIPAIGLVCAFDNDCVPFMDAGIDHGIADNF